MAACALDIETTGLGAHDRITCVAIVGSDWSSVWTLQTEMDRERYRDAIKSQLDTASLIYTYNGATFDIPFVQREFHYTNDDVGHWMLKLVDPLCAARALLGFQACAKLSDILALNGLQAKLSDGAEAVRMARDGRWEELAAYCESDARLTFQLMDRDRIQWKSGFQFSMNKEGLWH